ncbi:MAG TPA: crosslink repair DNA glycosylase YcaQ family protein [Pyrinomonadaceae bacterium]|nr:crosslink repair DNA glycosylase YcaQ family protein [Pyrinomonadaceae bacterium]
MKEIKGLPAEIEAYRDRKWHREDALRVETAEQAEAMVEELGFCLGLTDARKALPSIYTAVCGRRDAHMPRNVQKDPEASTAWVLKDEMVARGKVYYGKLVKGNSMFLAPRMIPVFNAIWGVPKAKEKDELSANALKVLKVLRKEWEMATADLRAECGFEKKADLTKAIDELQRRMKVIPQEVLYFPKFTYIWTLAEGRFPTEMKRRMDRETAVRELARCYLAMCGMTQLGDLSRTFGFQRWEAGRANHQLVDEGFAERLATGIYRLVTLALAEGKQSR